MALPYQAGWHRRGLLHTPLSQQLGQRCVFLCPGGSQKTEGEMLLRAEALPPGGHAHLRRQRDPLPLGEHSHRTEDPGGAPGHHRLPGLRHFGSGGSGHLHPRLPLCAGQRAEPGAAAPVGDRAGDQGGHGQIRHCAGCYHRLRRRRRSSLPG